MKVLIITSRYPLPARRGNQVRTVEWLHAMEGWHRGLVCPRSSSPEMPADPVVLADSVTTFPHSVASSARGAVAALVNGAPLQEGIYNTRAARRAVVEALDIARPDVAVVQMVRCGWAMDVVHSKSPETAVIFDAIDSMGLHFDRAKRAVHPLSRWLYGIEARRCRRRERALGSAAEISTAVSMRDLMALEIRGERGRVVPVSGTDMSRERGRPGRPIVVLTGNLGYRPTVAGALWFAREVWPELSSRVDGVRWVLAGARPSGAIRRLADLRGVEVHADVPDMAPILATATVAIAPMESGSGVPMKVLEAWSASLPVVAHPWAAWGLAGEGAGTAAVAATPEQWIKHLVQILTDREHAGEMGGRGRSVWERSYGADRIANRIREAVRAAVSARRPRHETR